MKKNDLMKMPKVRRVKAWHFAISCPHCGKELESAHMAQLNSQYVIHVKNCKDAKK